MNENKIMIDERSVRQQIGKRIKKARQNKGMTQAQLAEILECNPKYISQIEISTAKVSLGKLIDIANALNESIDYFFGPQESNDLVEIINSLNKRDRKAVETLIKVLAEPSE